MCERPNAAYLAPFFFVKTAVYLKAFVRFHAGITALVRRIFKLEAAQRAELLLRGFYRASAKGRKRQRDQREQRQNFSFHLIPPYLPSTQISPIAATPSLLGALNVTVTAFTSISLKSSTRLLPANISSIAP